MAEGGGEISKEQLDEEDNEEEVPLERRKKMFSKELRCMMYGFGDDQNPYQESVDILEDLVIEYITEMTKKAMEVGRPGKISVEDIIFLIRKDPKKYSRVKELLLMSEELRKARKAFDEVKSPLIPDMDKATSGERVLWAEAEAAINDIAFAVTHAAISDKLPKTDEYVYINLEIKEGNLYCVQLSVRGFSIVDDRFDSVQENRAGPFFETIYSLLDQISPQYRNLFGNALISKLSGLKELQDENQAT